MRESLHGSLKALEKKNRKKRIHESHFLCGFCAASEVSELCEKQSKEPEQSPITGEFFSLLNADSNEQYGRRDDVRIFGVKEEADEDVYEKVVDVAMKVGHQMSKTGIISICHRVPSRNLEKDYGRPINVKFVRKHTNSGLEANKKLLKDCE